MSRIGEKWSREDDEQMVISYVLDKDNIFTLSKNLKRTCVGVGLRLIKLKVVEKYYNIRGFDELESYIQKKLI
jgi:hypothetical protein